MEKIKLPKTGFVRIKLHRRLQSSEIIKNVTIEKTLIINAIYIAFECLDVKNNNEVDNEKEVVDNDKKMGVFFVSIEGENHLK
ncbi:Transposase (plasmid) [Borrelia nietonii YOR]|uniref:Transposase n=2 Tax=Borrelia TaxID=138 RepID=W5T604_BORHE|nr:MULTISPECIES: hypothetical protein [Borrelia]AHH03880.1 Transposase [Borrelia nietonii YOR]AHH14368.1 Transposase [Borrelia hermsii MTW]UPA09939.1 hypothetical protein bhYOR_001245 [Borrelia nietonii YOR]